MKQIPFYLCFYLGINMLSTIHADIPNTIESKYNNPSLSSDLSRENEVIATFIPPKGWHLANKEALQRVPSVKVMVVGKSTQAFPPSINLSTESFKGSLKEYLKIVKAMNDSKGYEWKNLGMIETQSGPANLSQVDTQSQWGIVRMMHVILIKDEKVYILTASALKDEFSNFYKEFFDSLKSLKVDIK